MLRRRMLLAALGGYRWVVSKIATVFLKKAIGVAAPAIQNFFRKKAVLKKKSESYISTAILASDLHFSKQKNQAIANSSQITQGFSKKRNMLRRFVWAYSAFVVWSKKIVQMAAIQKAIANANIGVCVLKKIFLFFYQKSIGGIATAKLGFCSKQTKSRNEANGTKSDAVTVNKQNALRLLHKNRGNAANTILNESKVLIKTNIYSRPILVYNNYMDGGILVLQQGYSVIQDGKVLEVI